MINNSGRTKEEKMKQIIFAGFLALALLVAGNFDGAQAGSMHDALDAGIRTSDITIPRTLRSGKSKTVKVRVKNIGDVKWNSGREFTLHSRIYRGPSGSGTQRDELTPTVLLKGDVNTGAYHTFVYEIEAPDYKGEYIIEWSMQRNSRDFGDRARKNIRITE